ncbi:GDSL-type esterase/lipase family protein [Hydrotalea sp.]|uniref:SGNH/GDSL hydrolase family protein n=1 Tax=Hydrotalea sp. TaxID=2881279 RepID=UPI002615B961|nr:GDSL-type esterase/lipase family protein [Hydrotalea sp.]
MKPLHQILCLGDSYTMGEGVPLFESFPYQLMQHLRQMQVHCNAPEIVAKTGWTSFELAEYLIHHSFSEKYDIATLLIGVNNQYRNLDNAEFENDYQFLVQKAIHLAGNQPHKVIGISIPDWGYSPFAWKHHSANIEKIHTTIDTYNAICAKHCKNAGVQFVDITQLTNQKLEKKYFTSDGLHYSGAMYYQWVQQLLITIKQIL